MDAVRRGPKNSSLLNSANHSRSAAVKAAVFLGMSGLLSTGCDLVGYRPLTPSSEAHLETSGAGFSARVERIHVDYVAKNPAYRVDVRIENQLEREVHIAPEKIELALLGPANADIKGQKTEPGSSISMDMGAPVGGAIAGAQAGSSLGRSTGSGGVGGGVVGAGLGMAGALVLMLPLLAVVAIDAAILEGEKDLEPGESGTYRIVLPSMSIDDGKPYGLMLDGALGLSRGTLTPLPLTRPNFPHLGYLPPGDATWIFSIRVGGGAVRRAPYTGGLGGFEMFIGKQYGRFAVGGFGMLGAGAWGGEMRLRFDPAKVVTIVPFFGYGYYPIVGYLGFNAGHGARWGVELLFSPGQTLRFGYPQNSSKIGIYAVGGPIFLRGLEGAGFAGQAGLSFGIF